MAYISESVLYICFSLVIGYFILQLVPAAHKPTIVFPQWLVLLCVIIIPVMSYVPLHLIVLEYADAFQLGYIPMIRSILLDLPVGEAWLWTLLGSIGLAIMVGIPAFAKDRHMPKVGLLLTLLLSVWFGFASHASSLSSFRGLVVHTGHFTSVTIWLGILFIVSWFATDYSQWAKFLKWFSPLAIVCVLMSLIAGITLMTFTTEQYNNGLMLNYGQYMLIKHIAILPLLWLAFSNGYLYPRRMKEEQLSPKGYLRAESILALVVLIVTAIMGQQAPPHNVLETLQTESPSKLFSFLFQGSFSPDIQLTWQFNLNSVMLWIAALLMLYVSYIAFKQRKIWIMVIVCLLFIILGYLGYMFGIIAI